MLLKKTVPFLAAGALLTLAACGSANADGEASADGVLMGPGVTDSEINVAIMTDYSGPIAEAGTAGSVGLEVKFDSVNAAGGVCGREIVLKKVDTKYDAQVATQQYRAIANEVLMIPQFVGSTGLLAVKDNIARDGMPTFAASLNTATLALPYVGVNLPTFEVELANGVVWAAEKAGASESSPKKVAMVTSADAYGETYADAITFAVEHTPGLELVASTTFAATDTDYTAQVSELKKSGADIVMLGVTPAQPAGLVGQSAQLGFDPIWVVSSGGWSSALAKPLAGMLDNFYVSSGYGTQDDDVPGTTDLRAALAEFAPKEAPNNFQVGGWLVGTATVAALEKACENKDLTREGVLAAMQDLDVEYDGILPAVNLGDGDTIVSYQSRMNTVGAEGQQLPIGDFYETEAAKAWGEQAGF